jgi:uncharacterized metal-binding protein YceD (DUF177 family)
MRRQDLLDLDDVLQHPGRKLAVDISTELPEEVDIDLATPIDGYIEAVSTGNLLLITGSFSTRIHTECARCSAALETDLQFEVDEQFSVEGVPSSLSAQDYARVVSDEPFPLFDENSLAVEALLRQDLLLAVPTQIFCSYGWDGDCPVARNLNAGLPASHREPEIWSGLSAFRGLEDLN